LPSAATYHLKVETLPRYPKPMQGQPNRPNRQAVRKAGRLLRQHAKSFPPEVWAEESDALLKEGVLENQKNVATILASLMTPTKSCSKPARKTARNRKLWAGELRIIRWLGCSGLYCLCS